MITAIYRIIIGAFFLAAFFGGLALFGTSLNWLSENHPLMIWVPLFGGAACFFSYHAGKMVQSVYEEIKMLRDFRKKGYIK